MKEGGGEYELMRCCREEPHTNIVRAGQEGEKDNGKAENKETERKIQIIEWKGVRSPEKRDINSGREIARAERCELSKMGWKLQPKGEEWKRGGGGRRQEVKDRQA